MLSVWVTTAERTLEIVQGVCAAASKLKMMGRSHLNWTRLTQEEQNAVEHHLRMQMHFDHQLIYHKHPTEATAQKVRAEFIVHEGGSADEVRDELLSQWERHNGRFLNGNFSYLSIDALHALYPQYNIDRTEAIRKFIL
jgi:hypothetical protein